MVDTVECKADLTPHAVAYHGCHHLHTDRNALLETTADSTRATALIAEGVDRFRSRNPDRLCCNATGQPAPRLPSGVSSTSGPDIVRSRFSQGDSRRGGQSIRVGAEHGTSDRTAIGLHRFAFNTTDGIGTLQDCCQDLVSLDASLAYRCRLVRDEGTAESPRIGNQPAVVIALLGPTPISPRRPTRRPPPTAGLCLRRASHTELKSATKISTCARTRLP